jgi:predicted dehydrogenase
MIRVGIIGAGNIARAHLDGYRAFPQLCRIDAVCDVDPQRAQALAAGGAAGGAASTSRVFDDYNRPLETIPLDLVSICTPPSEHAAIAVACLHAGVSVLVEKPMARSLQECDAMLAAASESGRLLSVVSQNRFRDDFVILKEVVDSGLIGEITHVQVDASWWRARAYYDLEWRGTWASEGGGATMNQAIHYIDSLLWITGRPHAVTAVLANAAHDNSEVEDLSVAILQIGHGLAEITSSTVDHGEEQSIVVYGKRARVSQPWRVVTSAAQPNGFPAPGGDPELAARLDGLARDHVPLAHTGHEGQIGDVLAALRSGQPPAVTGEDGRAAIELVTAIYESGTERRTVDLPIRVDDPYYLTGGVAARAPHFYEKTGFAQSLPGEIIIGSIRDSRT